MFDCVGFLLARAGTSSPVQSPNLSVRRPFRVVDMPNKRLPTSIVLVAFLATGSCNHTEPLAVHPAIAIQGQHWMQGERLKTVMGQIVGLHEAFPKGLPEDAESPDGVKARRVLTELASVANALANTATNIPAAVENKSMSDADRRGFRAEAIRLHDQAILLRDAARARQVEPLQGMRDDINATCISCHSRYRDISGDLTSHRASASTFDRDIAASAVNTGIRPMNLPNRTQ